MTFGPTNGAIRTWLAALILLAATVAVAIVAPEELLPHLKHAQEESRIQEEAATAYALPVPMPESEPEAEPSPTPQPALRPPPRPVSVAVGPASAEEPGEAGEKPKRSDIIPELVPEGLAKQGEALASSLSETFSDEAEEASAALDTVWSMVRGQVESDIDKLAASVSGDAADEAESREPSREVPAISFGEALSVKDARSRWTRLQNRYGGLDGLTSAVAKTHLWSVVPVHALVVFGKPKLELLKLCAKIQNAGTKCETFTLSTGTITEYIERRPEAAAPSSGDPESQPAAPSEPAEESAATKEQKDALLQRMPRVHHLAETRDSDDPRTMRLVAVGDVMMGSDYPSPHGLHPRLGPGGSVRSVLGPDLVRLLQSGDVTFANLEGVLADGGAAAKACANCYAFRSPLHYAEHLVNAGVTVASLANNHSGDFGQPGRDATVAALNARGIAAVGLDKPGLKTASLTLDNGLRVGIAAFAPNRGTVSFHDLDGAARLVADLARHHDIVVASVHAGAEGAAASRVPRQREIYLGEDRGDVHRIAHTLVQAGADVILGHGPHVPRAVELVDGKLIAYSLGNFWTYSGFLSWGVLGLGPVVDVSLNADGTVRDLTIHSTRQAGLGVPQLDPRDEARRFVLDRTRRDFPQTYALLTRKRGPLVADARGPLKKRDFLDTARHWFNGLVSEAASVF